MPKPTDREIEESYDRMGLIPDAEDEALINHIFVEDYQPPQGLRRGGYKEPEVAEEDDYLHRL